jgi:uncharacterized phage protein gp47/JayE
MVIKKKSLAELNQAALDRLVQDTDITAISPGSIARSLVETVNVNIEDLFDSLDLTVSQTFISQATGFYLDLIGELFGARRRNDVRASVYADDQQIRFYVRDGTLGDRLPHPTDTTKGRIASGTLLTTRDGTISWQVQGNHDFDRTATEVFVGATASSTGTQGNLGEKDLVQHSLGVSGVFVENVESIRTGIDIETDEQYRARIISIAQSRNTPNEIAVRLAAMQVPGVADVILQPNIAGAGSFRALVIPQGNRVATDTLLLVARNLRAAAAYGMHVVVATPDYIPVSMIVKVHVTNQANINPIKQKIEAVLLGYLGSLRPNQQLVINRVRQLVLDADPNIEDLEILELCISRKPVLIQNHRLGEDELFVPDRRLGDPIRII